MKDLRASMCAAIAIAAAVLTGNARAAPGDISLISVRLPNQSTSMYGSYGARLSGDGRFLAFFSTSPDLVPQFTNARKNLFVLNRQTGVVTPVAIDPGNSAYNASDAINSFAINADGRYVAFTSTASYVVSGDTNNVGDVFVRDRQSGATERVSVSSGGAQAAQVSYAPSISADGRFVAFASRAANLVPGDSNKVDDVFVHDRATGQTERVSVNTAGVQGNASSFAPAISADGRYVAFTSNATNLVAGDTNTTADIFVHDRQTGSTARISVVSGGAQANGSSAQAAISSDGRFVAFSSDASNLVAGDTNAATDIFVRDRQAGTTERVSVASKGQQGNAASISTVGYWGSISGDGRFVAFNSTATNLVANDTNGAVDVFVRDRLTGQTMLASLSTASVQANAASTGGSLSADGHLVGFDSYGSNLVTADRNATVDVFVRDRQASSLVVGSANNVKSTAAGSLDLIDPCDYAPLGGPSISADGRFVAFTSTAPDLVAGQPSVPGRQVPVDPYAFVRDRQTAKTVQLAPKNTAENVALSADASTAAIWGECTEGAVIDRLTGTTELLPGYSSDVALSSDGRYLAFLSYASDVVPGDTNGDGDIFVLDRRNHGIQRVNVSSAGAQSNLYSDLPPTINADGRYVVFSSIASNLVSGDTNGAWDVFVRDRQAGTTERVSVATSGQQANSDSFSRRLSISADGRFVAFASQATNLVPGDTNAAEDVFVRDRQTGQTERVSVSSSGVAGNADSSEPNLSPDGRYVMFSSDATNLVPNYPGKVFVRDRQTGVTEGLLTDPRTQDAISDSLYSLSADQRLVAFASHDSLVAADLNESALADFGGHGFHSLSQDIYLQERAVAASALTVSPKALAFGSRPINTTSAAKSVTVTNTGATAVPITGIALAGANPGQFGFTHNCGTSLAGNSSCTVKVVFKPTSKGAKSAALNVNGGGGGLRTVSLTGTGT